MSRAPIAQLAHELRTPLAVIRGFADLLGDDSLDDRAQTDYAARIAQAAERISEILDVAEDREAGTQAASRAAK